MADRFTEEQRAAIESSGKTIVSASAGSGKTTVMIEKIIRLIKSGTDVSEILAVTFTKKAASQMKEKLRKAIVTAINDPSTEEKRKQELKKQLDEVASADISTIHSFCSKLIRAHFYAAGIDSSFRVIGGDDAEGTAMKNAVLDELLEEGYEERSENFLHLLSLYWRKKSDNAFRKIVLNAYKEIRNRADYREYLERSGNYTEQTFDAVCADLHGILVRKCRYYLALTEKEREYFQSVEAKPQLALVRELIDAVTAVIGSENYFSACALEKPKFTAKRTSKKDSDEKRMHIERLAAIKSKVVKIYDDELLQTRERETELADFLKSGRTAAALAEQLLKFDEKYSELKAERGVLDYNDLEHKALSLLKDGEIAAETREKYRYVFVDEYQDVNPVQEEILSRIGGENLFLVGDVKQSIYGFRGSKSKFFVEKQKQFEAGGGESLVMKRNFRSSDAVLDAVNSQFSLAMTKENSSVDYASDSYMERGGRYALKDGRVQLHFLEEEEKKERETRGIYSVRESADKKTREEIGAAKTLKAIIEKERSSKWYDADSGEYREVRYSDIAILSRKKQGRIALNVAALAAEGIPVTAAAAVNVCDYTEVKTLIDILSLIDNAEQDVPLCSALLSTLGNLTVDDLTDIRLAYPNERLFRNACRKYVEEKQDETAHKLNKFYAFFEEIRLLSCVMDAGELLAKIIADTRMETRLLTRENGAACLKRIHRFLEEASTPQPLCVHEFLDKLRDMEYKIEFSENGGEDSVKVLTMHSSKGLEYPVVILDDLNAPFKSGDREEAFIEEIYGLAPRAFDEEKMVGRDTLLRRLHEYREAENSVADELNLYYVALTRAKYSLHLLFKKPSILPDTRYARSFADFTDFGVWEKYIVKDEPFDVKKQERQPLVFHPDEALSREIMEAFLWEYPYSGYENLPVKSSATALMKNASLSTEPQKSEGLFDESAEDIPKTDTALGIAYHAFLEHFDFSLLYGEKKLSDVVRETLSGLKTEDKELLCEEQLVKILSNPVFRKLRGYTLYKEQQFLVSLPVKDTYALKEGVDERLKKRTDGEEMLFQGAIDLLAVGEGESWIIDYKYSKMDEDYLRSHYKPQLRLYKMTVAKILGIPMGKIRCSIVNICRGFQVDIDTDC